MAHLWTYDTGGGGAAERGWARVPLDAAVQAVRNGRPHAVSAGMPECDGVPVAQLLRRPTPAGDAWVLVGMPAVRVNGSPLAAGIRVLRDRDELVVGGSRVFFSTESLAAIEPFAGDEAVSCPRCGLGIPPRSPAVLCPHCRVYHHQSDELPCWTYTEHCATCDQSTALEAGFRWTPEALWGAP